MPKIYGQRCPVARPSSSWRPLDAPPGPRPAGGHPALPGPRGLPAWHRAQHPVRPAQTHGGAPVGQAQLLLRPPAAGGVRPTEKGRELAPWWAPSPPGVRATWTSAPGSSTRTRQGGPAGLLRADTASGCRAARSASGEGREELQHGAVERRGLIPVGEVARQREQGEAGVRDALLDLPHGRATVLVAADEEGRRRDLAEAIGM